MVNMGRWIAVAALALMVAAVIALTLLAASPADGSPANPPRVTPEVSPTGETPAESEATAVPVKPLAAIGRSPIGVGVSFAWVLYLIDAGGLLETLESSVTYLDYLAGRAAHGDVSPLRVIAAAGATGDVFSEANTTFMDFRLPRSGVFYNRWLIDLLAEGRDAQAALIERLLTAGFEEAPTGNTYTELAARYQSAAHIWNDLAQRP